MWLLSFVNEKKQSFISVKIEFFQILKVIIFFLLLLLSSFLTFFMFLLQMIDLIQKVLIFLPINFPLGKKLVLIHHMKVAPDPTGGPVDRTVPISLPLSIVGPYLKNRLSAGGPKIHGQVRSLLILANKSFHDSI